MNDSVKACDLLNTDHCYSLTTMNYSAPKNGTALPLGIVQYVNKKGKIIYCIIELIQIA